MGSNTKNCATLYHQFEEKGRANYCLNLGKRKVKNSFLKIINGQLYIPENTGAILR